MEGLSPRTCALRVVALVSRFVANQLQVEAADQCIGRAVVAVDGVDVNAMFVGSTMNCRQHQSPINNSHRRSI